MRQHTILSLTAAATVALSSVTVAAPQKTLVHVNQITLGAEFSETSGYGDFPLSIAFDGSNAYIGGWNNGPDSPDTIGIVKVLNVTSASPSTQLLPNTLITSPELRGFDALAYDASTDSIFTFHDSGVFLTSSISRRNAADGSEVWTTTAPINQRVVAGAIDPIGDNGSPAVAFLAQGQGRRLALKISDGSVLYDGSGGSNPGGIILGEKGGTTDFGTAWRGLAFDSAGNIAVSEQDYVGYGIRIGINQWQNLDATNDRLSKSVEKDVPVNFVGQGVVIMEGIGVDGDNLLAFVGRDMTQTTDLAGNVTGVSDNAVHIRNLDGSTTGLSQITLTGSEDGIGVDWQNNAKNLAFGLDNNGIPTLLVLDFIERRLDVYQAQTVSLTGDLDGDGFVGIADLNIILGNWNLNVTPGDLLAGDPSGDGFVGIDDLNTVLGNWNAGTPPANGTAVPEPASLTLLGLGGLALMVRKR